MASMTITPHERSYLRELAWRQRAYAELPIMAERRRAWQEHNSGRNGPPIVVVDIPGGAQHEMRPPLKCVSPAARAMERELLFWISNHEIVDDDKVVPDFFPVSLRVWCQLCSMSIPTERATDLAGGDWGYRWDPPIKDLRRDFHLLQPSSWGVDRESTAKHQQLVEDVLGDILPVIVKNTSLVWAGALTGRALTLMGMEGMFCAMHDYPAEFRQMMAFLRDDLLAWIRWQEAEGLLTLDNDNDYAGSGSYGFSNELPRHEHAVTGRVSTRDIWFNMNSQETVGVAPEMYGEFVAPYYYDLAREFGLIYYGCCEPVHGIWDPWLRDLPNLRKLSISPWCNEEAMGEALRGSEVIYCRKPSPNFLAVTGNLDEEAYAQHIRRTVQAAKGCTLEISLRDLCTLGGRPDNLTQAVRIIRRELGRL